MLPLPPPSARVPSNKWHQVNDSMWMDTRLAHAQMDAKCVCAVWLSVYDDERQSGDRRLDGIQQRQKRHAKWTMMIFLLIKYALTHNVCAGRCVLSMPFCHRFASNASAPYQKYIIKIHVANTIHSINKTKLTAAFAGLIVIVIVTIHIVSSHPYALMWANFSIFSASYCVLCARSAFASSSLFFFAVVIFARRISPWLWRTLLPVFVCWSHFAFVSKLCIRVSVRCAKWRHIFSLDFLFSSSMSSMSAARNAIYHRTLMKYPCYVSLKVNEMDAGKVRCSGVPKRAKKKKKIKSNHAMAATTATAAE